MTQIQARFTFERNKIKYLNTQEIFSPYQKRVTLSE